MATMYSGLGGPAGYGENVFSTSPKAAGGNDDGSVYVDVTSIFGPAGINFYGTYYTGFYINSNGTINFGAPSTDFSTSDLSAETDPMIAVFWTDINIASGGEIYWDVDTSTGAITITWDACLPSPHPRLSARTACRRKSRDSPPASSDRPPHPAR